MKIDKDYTPEEKELPFHIIKTEPGLTARLEQGVQGRILHFKSGMKNIDLLGQVGTRFFAACREISKGGGRGSGSIV